MSVPKISDLSSEPKHVLDKYGATNSENQLKADFARNCILGRRLIEKGVRFVQIFNGAYASGGRINWDGHSQLKSQYDVHGEILDQPVAGLLADLKQRGLLDDTLVIWGGEFGRTPVAQVSGKTYGRLRAMTTIPPMSSPP